MAKSWKDEKKVFGSPNQEADNVALPLSLAGVLLNLLPGISTHFPPLRNNFLKYIYYVTGFIYGQEE